MSDQQQDSLGWRAGLPDDLKANESFVPYKTVGDFAKAHLDTAAKLKDAEGKLGNSIPKLGENATQEEREKFFNSLGRPESPDGYELEGGDREREDALKSWKADFHELGFTSAQAKGLKGKFDARLNAMADEYKANNAKQVSDAAAKLKTELGDKYDASVELASRLWKRATNVDLDAAFDKENSVNRYTIIRYILDTAAKTGEDSSMRGSGQRQTNIPPALINYDKSPAPPRRPS